MKKICIVLLVLMLSIALFACDDKKNDPDKTDAPVMPTSANLEAIVSSEDYNATDPTQYVYRSVFANSPYKDEWDTSSYGADIDDIWDSSVLPSVFPQKPDSVTEIDRTGYVGLFDKKHNYSAPGMLYVNTDYESENKLWQYYYVMFDGTENTFTTLCADLATRFECYDDRNTSYFEGDKISGEYHAFSTEWYCYLIYSQQGSYDWSSENSDFIPDADGKWSFTLYAMPVHHALPQQVEGLALPQFGYLMNGVFELVCYQEGDDDFTWIEYDFNTGTPAAPLLPNWYTYDICYYGATRADAIAYGQQLEANGFSKKYSSDSYEMEILNISFVKDNMQVNVDYDADEKYVNIVVYKGYAGYFGY